ncbi:MAG: 30S ribosomal protein S16 [Phycisphaerae bacterium]|nr:30S ribosomal protein S16 [Phycisphaerae bacterium]
MAVKLRLKRFGRRHRAYYRLNAIDGRSPRDGRVIEQLGTYDPIEKDPAKAVQVDRERVEYWLGVGAVPSQTVAKLLNKQGIAAKSK